MTILKFRLVRNLSWMTLEHGFRMTVGVLVGAIVARYLGPAAYGTLNYASALVAICATLHAIVPEPLIIREIVADRRNTSDILGAAVAVRTVFALFAYVLLFAFPLLLPSTPEPYAIASYIIGVILFFQTTDVLASWFQAQQHSQPVVLSRLGGFFLSSILRLLLVWSGASMFSFAAAIAIESAITTLFILISVRLAKERPLICWPPAVAHVKTLLLNGWPLFLAAISATLYLRLDLVMIGIMKSDHETGLYSAATRISEIWYFIPMSLAVVVQPVLLGKRRLGGGDYARHLRALYGASAWVAALFALTTALLAEKIILLLFGKDFINAVPILQIHAWSAIPVFLGVASSQYLVSENLVKLSWYRTTIGLFVNVVLNLIWIPRYGGVGAAWATLISYFVATFSLCFFPSSRAQAAEMLFAMTPRGLLQSWLLFKEYQSKANPMDRSSRN